MPTTQPPRADDPHNAASADAFASLGLSPAVLEAVARLGFAGMSPIQAAAIPLILAGHDIVGQSETGSGKTAAFCIPAIERVDTDESSIQVLVLAPTRELATQITDEARKFAACRKTLRAVAIYGGAAYERQFAELKRGAHVVVGTPGRLCDHLARGTLDLSAVRILILDDVNDLELVVNYDLPADADDYVHRIGRTGRAGRAGRALTLVCGRGIHTLRAIERLTKTTIRREQLPSVVAVAAAARRDVPSGHRVHGGARRTARSCWAGHEDCGSGTSGRARSRMSTSGPCRSRAARPVASRGRKSYE